MRENTCVQIPHPKLILYLQSWTYFSYSLRARYTWRLNQGRQVWKFPICLHHETTPIQFRSPHKPHFYIIKLGFTGIFIIFLILLKKNRDCGYSLEPPLQGGSNEYPQSMFWAGIWKIYCFIWKFSFFFWVVKFSIYLNRRVFVMTASQAPSQRSKWKQMITKGASSFL